MLLIGGWYAWIRKCVTCGLTAVNMHSNDSTYPLCIFLLFSESSYCCHSGHYLGPIWRLSDIV